MLLLKFYLSLHLPPGPCLENHNLFSQCADLIAEPRRECSGYLRYLGGSKQGKLTKWCFLSNQKATKKMCCFFIWCPQLSTR